MNSKKLVFIAMAAILALSALPLVSAMPSDNNISSSWATTTPTIDGYISADEWTDATPVDITNEASYIVTMYVKNDGNKLYLAFDDPTDSGTSVSDYVVIHFDDEPTGAHNGLWDYTSCPSGEGYLDVRFRGNKFVGIIAGPEFCDPVTPAPGVNSDISSIIGHVQREVAIDLSTSALKGSLGDEIGVYINVWNMDDKPSFDGLWPDTGIKYDPSTYGNLTLATGESPNRRPVADAGPDQTVREGQLVTLNGTASFDLDGDPLTYSWKQFSGPRQTLIGANTARPTFTPKNVYPRHNGFVFKLIVDDGKGGRDIDDVTITGIPNPPQITSFDPTKGWAGNDVTINGTELLGSDIYIGGVKTGTVGPFTGYDNQYTFRISPDVPYGRSPITVRTWVGESTSFDEFEVFVRPDYCLRWGFAFHNPRQDLLTYPHLPWDEGSYKDTFGEDQVYITIWVCAGLPVCVPFLGCWCAGYEIEEPICPDPLAEIYYWAAYWYLASPGECFGMSANSLQLYNGDLDPGDFYFGALNVNQLKHLGELDRRIDYMHGSQVSMECLEWYTNQALVKVAFDPLTQRIAMLLFLEQVEDSIESGSLGIISVLDGHGHGHAVVPYLVEDVDADHTRIYVYDSNREWFSEEKTAIDALMNYSDVNNYPPYIEIDKSGVYWSWFFERDYGDKWGGYFLIFFLPYSIVNGDRTLPTSWKGMLDFIHGDATSQIEDESGRTLGVDEHGELLIEIPNAIPMPGTEGKGYALPMGNYTRHIRGQTDGTYNWSAFSNGSAFAIQGADVTSITEDRVVLNYEDNNPLTGLMSFETSDATKEYSATLIKNFKEQSVERIYRVKNTRISQGSVASFEVSPNFDSLIYTNDGPETITYDVEIQTNMVSQEVADRGPITKLPTATRTSIVIGPYEKHVLTPENWLDLNQTTINLKAIPIAKPSYRVPILKLLGLITLIGLLSVIVVITIRRRQK
jgi:hypothetical protein